MGDSRRCESQRGGGSAISTGRRIGLARSAAACANWRRERLSAARESRLHGPRWVCREHFELAAGDGVRMPISIDGPRWNERPDRADRAREDARGAAAIEGGPDAARLSARISRCTAGAELYEPVASVLRSRLGRLERRLGAAGTAGRHDLDARRTL